MQRRTSLLAEALEVRQVPATFGIPWHDPQNLTISFAPDGTPIASHASELNAALDPHAAPEDWQRTILLGFQTWAVHANLNFAVVPDQGDPFGAAGFAQGDPRFGDFRIGAHSMAPDVLAVSIPPDPALTGTWSGDVLLNSTAGVGEALSLQAVVTHEAGNALGLADSDNPAALMYGRYSAGATELTAEDIARIQTLYGVRAPDPYEGLAGNGTLARASRFRLPAGFKGETPLVAFGDVTSTSDVDVYAFNFHDDGNDDAFDRSATIRLQTAGVSLLAPKLTLLDARGRVLATDVSTSFTGDVLQFTVDGLSASGTYYVRVEAGTDDVFGIGRYGLSVRLNTTSSTSDEVIARLLSGPFSGLGANDIDAFSRTGADLLLNADDFQNETTRTATRLKPAVGYPPNARYETIASLSKSEDVDTCRIVAPTGDLRVLTVSVWTASQDGFQPTVTVLNAAGRPPPKSSSAETG